MNVVIGLPDWYTPPDFDKHEANRFGAARESLTAHYPEIRLYEFLPVATLRVQGIEEAERLAAFPGVDSVKPATSALEVKGAAAYYDRMLSALSAIRSETGHQRYEWWNQAHEGETFPHADWTGGIWPAGPYPSVDMSGRVCRSDPSIVRWAEPAQIPVLSLSLGPPRQLPADANDPLVIALKAMSATHLIVVAAGNYGPDVGTMSPWALGDHILSVGAKDATGALWSGSSRGTRSGGADGPHVVANGVVPGDVGTSYSAPRVAVMGLFCAAVLSEVNAALNQAQDIILGAPLEALAIIDVSPQTLDVEVTHGFPFVEIPALPLTALNLNLAVDAFKTVLPSLAATLSSEGKRGLVNLPLPPQRIAQIVRAAARPLADSQEWESGAGYVDGKMLIEYLASVSIGELLRWLGFPTTALGHAWNAPAFHQDGLAILLETVTLTRPSYIYDVLNRKFVRGTAYVTQRGDLKDLHCLVQGRDDSGGGHDSRILNATLT